MKTFINKRLFQTLIIMCMPSPYMSKKREGTKDNEEKEKKESTVAQERK
jgi:hypothetical protein